MQTQATVIYHSGDFDGLFSREVARHFLKDNLVTYQGWDYGDPFIPFPAEGRVYVIDLNPEVFGDTMPGIDKAKERLVWIDHHKTAIDKWGTYIPGYRIEGVAACRLAWHWFWADHTKPYATKEDYLERKVSEPLAIRLAGEYDVWDHRGDGDLEFQLGLKAQDEIPFDALLDNSNPVSSMQGDSLCHRLIQVGRMVQTYVKNQNALKMKSAFILPWRGLKFLALNGGKGNSQVFASLDKPETGHDALMVFGWTGKAWEFSLYHAAHRKDIDLSEIAKQHGGGGHPGACGFRVVQIPFPLYPIK